MLGWIGFLMIIYMEIKTVSVRRERDEREKLVAIRAMERTKAMEELEATESKTMAPRAYVTICGAVLLFVGLFCQLIPFCHLLSELGLPVAFHGFCPLFVMTSAFMLTACAVLLILGVVWSCTRGWAALVLLTLGLLGRLPRPPALSPCTRILLSCRRALACCSLSPCSCMLLPAACVLLRSSACVASSSSLRLARLMCHSLAR